MAYEQPPRQAGNHFDAAINWLILRNKYIDLMSAERTSNAYDSSLQFVIDNPIPEETFLDISRSNSEAMHAGLAKRRQSFVDAGAGLYAIYLSGMETGTYSHPLKREVQFARGYLRTVFAKTLGSSGHISLSQECIPDTNGEPDSYIEKGYELMKERSKLGQPSYRCIETVYTMPYEPDKASSTRQYTYRMQREVHGDNLFLQTSSGYMRYVMNDAAAILNLAADIDTCAANQED